MALIDVKDIEFDEEQKPDFMTGQVIQESDIIFDEPIARLTPGKERFLARQLLPYPEEEKKAMDALELSETLNIPARTAYENRDAIQKEFLRRGVSGEDFKHYALPRLDYFDKVEDVRENPEQLIPFVAGGAEAVRFARLFAAVNRLEENTGETKQEQDDLKLLREFVDRSNRDTTFGYKVAAIVSAMPSFMGELLLTGGVYTAARKASLVGAKKGLNRLLRKKGKDILNKKLVRVGLRVTEEVGGRTAQAFVAGATRIPAGTLERIIDGFQLTGAEKGELQGIITGEGEDLSLALAKAMGEQWVEIQSEFTGGLLTKASKPIKNAIIKTGLFKSFRKLNPDASTGDVRKIFEKMGYHGVIGEMFEERVGEVGHGLLESIGLGDQKFALPSLEQLGVELVAFSVPGVTKAGLERAVKLGEAGFARTGKGKAGDRREDVEFREQIGKEIKEMEAAEARGETLEGRVEKVSEGTETFIRGLQRDIDKAIKEGRTDDVAQDTLDRYGDLLGKDVVDAVSGRGTVPRPDTLKGITELSYGYNPKTKVWSITPWKEGAPAKTHEIPGARRVGAGVVLMVDSVEVPDAKLEATVGSDIAARMRASEGGLSEQLSGKLRPDKQGIYVVKDPVTRKIIAKGKTEAEAIQQLVKWEGENPGGLMRLEPVSKAVPKKEEVKKPDSIKEIEELYADAIELADKKGDRAEVKRLKDELTFVGGKITTPSEMRKLRQAIHAWANVKGLTKKKLTELTRKATGQLSTKHKDVTVEQLTKLLADVKKARPAIVAQKKVVTLKTEKRIQTLKENLKKRDELTDEHFESLLESMRIKVPKYVTAKEFITESQGKKLIDRMLKTAPLVKDQIKVAKALKKSPQIEGSVGRLVTHFEKQQEGKPASLGRIQQLLDMHHFTDSMEKQTGILFGRMWEKLNDKRRELDRQVGQKIDKLQELGGEDFKKILADEEALKRINNYVASKLPEYVKGKPIQPTNITSSEKAIAEEITKSLKEFENDVRYNRFYEWREKGVEIPNAPISELNKATEILETQGDTALKAWLKGRSWGVIRTGYDIGEVIVPRIRPHKRKVGFGAQHLRPRESIFFQTFERDIIKRYGTYVRQMTFRTGLKTDINAWTTLFETNRHRIENSSQVADLLTRNIAEILGQRQAPAVLEEVVMRLYSQAARTIFLDVRKGVRNLFQNVAFYTGVEDMFRLEKMNPTDIEYFATHVSQSKGIQRDWLYQQYRGIPGLGRLNKIADEINVMGRTDTVNRLVAFRAKLGNVRRALKENPDYKTDVQAMRDLQKDIGFSDIEPMERVHALKVLATEGEGAFSRYMAKAITQKVHFLYERAQRSPAEQGNELSRLFSNLLTFRKGYAQRLILDVGKLTPSQKEIEAEIEGGRGRTVARSIIGMMVASAFASYIYMQLTGDERAPYAPHRILGDLSLGGLAVGAQEQVGNFTRDAMLAATGDADALSRTVINITRSADMFIPFYDEVINALEGMTDYQNIDKAVLRQLRSELDDRYKARPIGWYNAERNAIESGQHFLFGTEKERKPTGHKPTGL